MCISEKISDLWLVVSVYTCSRFTASKNDKFLLPEHVKHERKRLLLRLLHLYLGISIERSLNEKGYIQTPVTTGGCMIQLLKQNHPVLPATHSTILPSLQLPSWRGRASYIQPEQHVLGTVKCLKILVSIDLCNRGSSQKAASFWDVHYKTHKK